MLSVIALIVFGPQRLPEIARTVGKALSEVRRMASEAKAEFEDGLNLDEVEDEDEDEDIAPAPPAASGDDN